MQNGVGAGRIMRFDLSPGLDRVERAKVLETRNPLFDIPPTGVVVGEAFYYIANSQLRKLSRDGTITSPSALRDVVVLKLRL